MIYVTDDLYQFPAGNTARRDQWRQLGPTDRAALHWGRFSSLQERASAYGESSDDVQFLVEVVRGFFDGLSPDTEVWTADIDGKEVFAVGLRYSLGEIEFALDARVEDAIAAAFSDEAPDEFDRVPVYSDVRQALVTAGLARQGAGGVLNFDRLAEEFEHDHCITRTVEGCVSEWRQVSGFDDDPA